MKKKSVKMLVLTAVVVTAVSAAAFINATYGKRANKTAAVVNGEKIKLSDVDKRCTYVIDDLKNQYGENFEKEINKLIKSTEGEDKKKHEDNKKLLIDSRNDALDSMVDTRVLYLKGIQNNFSGEDDLKEVEYILEQFRKGTIQSYVEEGMTEKEAEEKYEKNKGELLENIYGINGMTAEEYKEYFKEISVSGKMQTKLYDSIEVSDDEIKKYYNDHIDDYVKKAGYDVRELFFPVINGNRDETSTAAQDTFFSMAEGNPNKSTDYDTVYSEAENKTHELSSAGRIIAQTNTVAFENSNRPKVYMDIIKDLSVGSYCSPIPTDEGYYMPYILNIRTEDDIKTSEDEKENIAYIIRSEKKEKVLDEKIKEYKKEFKVKIYKDNLSF